MRKEIILVIGGIVFLGGVSLGGVFGNLKWREKNTIHDSSQNDMPSEDIKFLIKEENHCFTDKLSLEEILLVEDKFIRKALEEDFWNNISDDELYPLLLSFAEKTDGPFSINLIFLQRRIYDSLTKDYDKSKERLLSCIDVLDHENLTEISNSLKFCLLYRWLLKDRSECEAFLKEKTSVGDQSWLLVLRRYLGALDLESSFWLLRRGIVYTEYGNEYLYQNLFLRWYFERPSDAYANAATLPYSKERAGAMKGILTEMIKFHPEEAMELIQREFKEDAERQDVISEMMAAYSRDNLEEAIVFLHGKHLSPDDTIAAYKGVFKNINASQLRRALEKSSMTKEEQRKMILLFFDLESKGLGVEGENAKYSLALEDAVSLFDSLNDEDQKEVIKNICFSETIKQPILALRLYQKLNIEEQSKDYALSLLDWGARIDPFFCANYYVDHVYGMGLEGNRGIQDYVREKDLKVFKSIIDFFQKIDSDGVFDWVNAINDTALRERARSMLNVPEDNMFDTLDYLKRNQNQEVARIVYYQVVNAIAQNGNLDSYVDVLLNAPDQKWVENAIDASFDKIASISDEYALDVIDALGVRMEYQDYAKERLAIFYMNKNPERSLELVLSLPPGPKTTGVIKLILDHYSKIDPKGAQKWKFNNGIDEK